MTTNPVSEDTVENRKALFEALLEVLEEHDLEYVGAVDVLIAVLAAILTDEHASAAGRLRATVAVTQALLLHVADIAQQEAIDAAGELN